MKLRMKRNLFAFVFFAFIVSSLSAQVHVVGNVLSEKGVGVEYVSVQVDSIYMISDSKGHFDITIPQGHTSNMIVSHLSFESQSIPFGEYKGGKVSVLLKEKSYILSDVTISNKKQKISQIVGTGVAIPGGVIYYNCNHTDYETGPVIRSNHNYQVTNVKFHVNECNIVGFDRLACAKRYANYLDCNGNSNCCLCYCISKIKIKRIRHFN